MPAKSPSRQRSLSRRRTSFVAVSARELEDGTQESLELSPDEVMVVRVQDGKRVTERLPLRELERVRTRGRVKQIELMVALSYLLGASVLLYLIVNLVDRLTESSLLFVMGMLVFFAVGGVAAAWFGQEAVVQFIARGRRRRVEFRVSDAEREHLRILEPLGKGERR